MANNKSAWAALKSKEKKVEEKKETTIRLKNPKNLKYNERTILTCNLYLGDVMHGKIVYCQYRGDGRIMRIAKENKCKDVVLEVINTGGQCI